jgi:molecular chaperone GrpE
MSRKKHESKSPAEPQAREPSEAPAAGTPSPEAAAAPSPAASELEARVESLGRELEELRERLKRATAEFSNETKRIGRQAEESRKYAVEGLIHDLIPVFDAFHSAREGLGRDEGSAPLRQGLDLVEKELMNVLSRHGVRRIEAAESPFDPGAHEALIVVDHPELPAGHVAQELRPGFTLHGRVVRPAHVAVVRARPTPPPEEAAADGPSTGGED